MKSFLEHVAEDIIQKHGTDLSRVTVVFPNKRASLFLNEHLARQAQRPIWSPAYITISELFRQQSDLHIADPIQSVCLLHQSFCTITGSDETLDKFYGWGQLLLSDFDDIDKNMADADRVLANLRDIHELDDLSYLTDEQRQMLQRFFSNFTEEHPTQLKERFLYLWSRMSDIYHDFHKRLASQGLAYEGMLYRSVIEGRLGDICGQTDDNSTPCSMVSGYTADIYIFVGFNLLQKVEQRLFSQLQKEGKASFYWDFDHFYTSNGHEAGKYISQYLRHFHNELGDNLPDLYDNFRQTKKINFISAPTENIQARYVSTWLQEHQERLKAGRRTAIVLCNEGLLPTVIHSLPPQVEKVNVTTGYPLSQTPVASFIQLWFDIQIQGATPRLMRTLRRHPYYKYMSLNVEGEWWKETTLTSLLKNIAQQGTAATVPNASPSGKDGNDPFFQESLFRAYTLINRLNDLIRSGVLNVTLNTLQRLVTQLIQQTSIPFHGEPAEGLQIMGVLETRNLDFDHVLLLSCGEGMMPRGVNDSSFIPHSIRHAYELTTVENKVGIYSYYFHRLLQRASDITILYNNSTEGGQRGEMSRFMLQLMVESPHAISHFSLTSGQQPVRWQPQPIQKSPSSPDLLPSTISPTAINTWLRCPLRYFYRYVAGLQEPEVPDDELELDNRMFGNVFHYAADLLYHRLPQYVDKTILQHLLHNKQELERAVDEAFHHEIPHLPKSGLYIIQREVIIQYLRQLVDIDCRQAPFRILGLEKDVYRSILLPPSALHPTPLRIGGRIDRLDLVDEGSPNERIRVVDYKTGARKLKPLPDVDAIFDPKNIHEHSDYYLQTLLYADIVSSSLSTFHLPSSTRVSPALLFIQHAAAEDYDPTLCFGHDKILDVAPHSTRFNELLTQTVSEILSPDVPYNPTTDTKVCATCPFAPLCRR